MNLDIIDGLLTSEHTRVFTKVLKRNPECKLIVDGGILLGILRDGKLLPWDLDIDIVLNNDNFVYLLEILDDFKGDVRFIDIKLFHNRPIMVEFNFNNSLPIAFHRFVLHGENFILPHYIWTKKIVDTLRKRKINGWRRAYFFYYINSLYYYTTRHLRRVVQKTNKFTKEVIHYKDDLRYFPRPLTKFWLSVPSKYFENLRKLRIDGIDFFQPLDSEEYLSYRYGDWKIEKKDWFYFFDDGSIKNFNSYNLKDYKS